MSTTSPVKVPETFLAAGAIVVSFRTADFGLVVAFTFALDLALGFETEDFAVLSGVGDESLANATDEL